MVEPVFESPVKVTLTLVASITVALTFVGAAGNVNTDNAEEADDVPDAFVAVVVIE
jgi:hypothetical protein